jgi:hypothetical protein
VKQPLRLPMDMRLSDDELWAWAEREAKKQPGFQPVEEWRAGVARRMNSGTEPELIRGRSPN